MRNNPVMLKKTDPGSMTLRGSDQPLKKMEIGAYMLNKHDPGETISRRIDRGMNKSLKIRGVAREKSAIARAIRRYSSGSIILSTSKQNLLGRKGIARAI